MTQCMFLNISTVSLKVTPPLLCVSIKSDIVLNMRSLQILQRARQQEKGRAARGGSSGQVSRWASLVDLLFVVSPSTAAQRLSASWARNTPGCQQNKALIHGQNLQCFWFYLKTEAALDRQPRRFLHWESFRPSFIPSSPLWVEKGETSAHKNSN